MDLFQKMCIYGSAANFGSHFYLGWGYTLFGFTWSFLIMVLVPYSLLYLNSPLKGLPALVKYGGFYALMVVMGLLFPDASLPDLFVSSPYPRVLVLYLFLTLTICPWCNLFLQTLVRHRLAVGEPQARD
jgi:hypothetical protein